MFRKKGAGDWKLSVEHAEKVPSLPIIGHALRNDLQTGPRKGLILKSFPNQLHSYVRINE